MKTTKQYETEKKVVKGVFWGMVTLFIFMTFIMYFNLNTKCISDCTDTILKIFAFSTLFLPISSVFFLIKNYKSWRFLIIVGIVLVLFNLNRESHDLDYLMTGPVGLTIVMSVCLFVVSYLLVLFDVIKTK